jgi:hypothetical protein
MESQSPRSLGADSNKKETHKEVQYTPKRCKNKVNPNPNQSIKLFCSFNIAGLNNISS